MANPRPKLPVPRCRTGIPGLDDILKGGLISHRLYLIDGDPGAGKTTLATPISARWRERRRKVPLHHSLRNQRGTGR